jgi:putative transposase
MIAPFLSGRGGAVKRGRRKKREVVLSVEQKAQLDGIASSRSMPHGLARRAQIVLWSAEGRSDYAIADRLRVSRPTVAKWRRRYAELGLEGLYDEIRPGRPRSIEDDEVAEVVHRTLETEPPEATHWTVRSMADECGLSKSTIQRIWTTFGLQPHRREHFKLSNDAFFVEKVRDICGLYLNPPDKALVLCVDEKSQIQALERSQPLLPLGLGYAEGVTHDYRRHGTTTLFAALDVANGQVITQCKKRHRHQEYLEFLRHIERNVPSELDVHLIVDNCATHKHIKVKRWLAERPHWQVHYTPTYSSWLNQVEIWFNIITQRAIRRGSFRSVKQLVEKIERFVENHNRTTAPFAWTATADSILQKVKRLCQHISGTQH